MVIQRVLSAAPGILIRPLSLSLPFVLVRRTVVSALNSRKCTTFWCTMVLERILSKPGIVKRGTGAGGGRSSTDLRDAA